MPKGHGIFDPEVHPKDLVKRMSKGQLNVQVFKVWGISKKTFYKWIQEHPDLAEAYDQGETACEAWWLEQMVEKWQAGDEKGFKYCQLIVNTKFGYKDTQNSSVTNNTLINVSGNMNILQDKSREDLIDFIKDGLEDNNIIDVNFKALGGDNGSQ